MKNYLLLCFLIFISISVAIAKPDNGDNPKKKTGEPLPKIKIAIGPTANYSIGKLDFGKTLDFRHANLNNFKNVGGGVLVDIIIGKKMFLQTELTYGKKLAIDPAIASENYPYYNYTLTAEQTFLNFPLSVGYTFPLKNFQPYIAGGFLFAKLLDHNLTREYPADVPAGNTLREINIRMDGGEIGILGEIGVRKNLGNKGIITLSTRYIGSEMSYVINSGAGNLSSRKMSVSIGCLVKFYKG